MNVDAGKIVDSELEVMRVLWSRSEPVALSELIQVLSEKTGWKEPTVKTVVRNLRIKGSIRLTSRGHYTAVITAPEYNEWSNHNYIGKVFDGSAKKLVASLLSTGQLTAEDIAELYAELNGGFEHG